MRTHIPQDSPAQVPPTSGEGSAPSADTREGSSTGTSGSSPAIASTVGTPHIEIENSQQIKIDLAHGKYAQAGPRGRSWAVGDDGIAWLVTLLLWPIWNIVEFNWLKASNSDSKLDVWVRSRLVFSLGRPKIGDR